MTWVLALLMIPLNRFRGGGLWADRLPGHPRWYAAGVVALIAWAMHDWQTGALAAVSYLAWCLPPWGRWVTLGYAPLQRGPASRSPTWFERTLERLTRSMSEAFLWRQTIGFVPAAILLTPWAWAAGPATWAVYTLAWETSEDGQEILNAELGTGVLWAVLLWWA